MQGVLSAIVEAEKSDERTLRIMDPVEGDLKITWDTEDDDQVELARKNFDAAKKKKMVAYEVKKDGSKGKILHRFEPDAEAIIMAPPLVGG